MIPPLTEGVFPLTGKRWKTFKLVSVLLVLSAFVCAVAGEKLDSLSMWTKLGIISCVSAAYLALFLSAYRNLHSFVSEMETQLDVTERDSLYKFPCPAAVIDPNGVIIWYNKAFTEKIANGTEMYGSNIANIAEIDLSLLATVKDTPVEYTTDRYRITATSTEKYDSRDNTVITKLSLLCFEDISEYLRIKDEYTRSRVWIMYIMIDGYDDIFSNTKDSDRSHVLMQIDKLMETFMEENRGIIRKISSDRFLAVIEEDHLQRLIDDQFRSILEKVRSIKLHDKTSITVSVGVGHGGNSVAESENLAKQALDMTQGRGGDQAAIKDDTDFIFFGGNSKGVEKHTKARTRIFSANLMHLIDQSDLIMIMGHKYSDFDSVGSAAGMCGAMRMMGKSSYICIDTGRTLSSMLINRLTDNLSEGDDIFISPEDSVLMLTENTLLIIVDTSVEEQLESAELYHSIKNVVYIDHHRQSAGTIDSVVSLHEPYASSASEIVTEVIQYLPLPERLSGYYADAMLAGITLDTKDFVNKTGVRTFEAAAYLRRLGADTVAVKQLFAISLESCHKRSQLIETAKVHKRCAIAVWKTSDPDVRIFSAQAADELLETEEVDASFVMYPCVINGDNYIKISARSYGVLNVQLIMEKLGGGGHQTMASTEIAGTSFDDAKQTLIGAIDEYLQEIS